MKGFLSFIHVAILLFLAACGATAQTQISGPLSGVLAADTYLVVDSIYVPTAEALTIEAGSVLLFRGYYNFRIYGHLNAAGTEQDSIFFGPAPGVDSLRSITFQAMSSDSSRMAYCYITGCAESAINIYSVPITIEHCTITDNTANWGGGIYCSGANATISECVVTNNVCRNNGGGIYATNCSPAITNCVVTGNLCNTLPTTSSGRGGGGICANHSASPVITGCTISCNHSIWNGGGISINDNSDMTLSHCLITDNSCDSSGGGIAMFLYCDPIIINCTISGDSAVLSGGGLYIEQCNPTIVNTIVEGNIGEGGVYFSASPTSTLSFCDFYNPATGNFAGLLPAELGIIDTVNANGDSCDAFSNIFLDPLFVNASGGDFTLQATSPCIDAGDPATPLDPDYTVSDLGVYYFHQDVSPQVQISADSLEFGAVIVGLDHTLPLTISNTGDAILIIREIGSSDPAFSTDFNPQDSLIWPGDQLEIAVSFIPTDCTEYLAQLNIENNDTLTQVQLHGWGVFETAVSDRPEDVAPYLGHFRINPNPFNPTTALSFQLSANSYVRLKIYDTAGRLVETLIDGWRGAGRHEVTFNGSALASGIYIYRLEAGEYSTSGKMVLMK